MRPLWIALLIALLPLRGWVGDAMALGWSPQPPQAAAVSAESHAAPAPCHQALPADASPEHKDTLHAHEGAACADCAACQICHSLALTLAVPTLAAAEPALPTPARVPVRFASAEPRRDTRPPIA